MERLGQSCKFESKKHFLSEIPVCELIFDIEKASKTWPVEYKNPHFIEQIKSRKIISEYISEVFNKLPNPTIAIEDALEAGYINDEQVVSFYDSLSNILEDADYQRLALYIPFEVLPNKSWVPNNDILCKSLDRFETSYLSAWYSLLNIQDVRANFVDGDVLEPEARPSDPPRVVKVAHLMPWLISHGMMGAGEILTLMNDTDIVLRRSVGDTIPVLDDMGFLGVDEKEILYRIKASIPAEEAQEPLFVSENRKKWLEIKHLDNSPARPYRNTPIANLPKLNGPFSDNLDKLAVEIDDISSKLMLANYIEGVYPVALLGGSQLKGYGCSNSDIDVYVFVKSSISEYEKSEINKIFQEYNPIEIKIGDDDKLIDLKEHWAHDLFNAAWIGDEKNITMIQQKLITDYFYVSTDIRTGCIERLEQDLLQYRLMHKGYARHYPIYSERLSRDREIDGQSAFYDSGYRQIATKLFIDKVFIPKISPI